MKLIIDIPEGCYEELKNARFPVQDAYRLVAWIQNSTPLDDAKAEIEKKCDRINSIASVLRYPQHREIQELLCEILASIDNAESEDKE